MSNLDTSSEDSNDEVIEKEEGFKTMNKKKRIKKSKRKLKLTPGKDEFLKVAKN